MALGEFEMDFKKSFCCGFNLSNDDIISVLCKHMMLRFVTTSRSENEYFTLYSTANDPQPQMIPRPQMIPKMDPK